ncbi:MAG: ATP-dependent Clp protease proteolytic subunit [Afipia sp.]
MSAIIAKARLNLVEPAGAPEDAPGGDAAVLRLSGAIGKGEPISEQGVRRFVGSHRIAARLHLVINSEGGNVEEANRIYHLLRALPIPISAEVNMKAWSAAVTILVAADFRWARKGASILIHRTRIDAVTALGDRQVTAPCLIDHASRLRRSDEHEVELLSLRTGYDRAWFSREQSTEDLISDQDAIICGLLHAVEGKAPFDRNSLQILDKFAPNTRKPSEMLAANYRAAARVAALCAQTEGWTA